MSGEQAEERTAREGRLIRAQKFMSKKGIPNLPHIDHETRGDIYTDELLDEYAESECSRLASRVEELEQVLRSLYEITMALEKSVVWEIEPSIMDYMKTTNRSVERVLAGAHAEEKF